MPSNHHTPKGSQIAANQNNQMSDDPGDGHRLTDNPEQREATAAEQPPEHDRQDQDTISAFGQRGASAEGTQDA